MVTDVDVTVVIPHIPTRAAFLGRALRSVYAQTHVPEMVIVVTDKHHEGSAETRNRALDSVTTDWVAFLDDDDELYPDHLETLLHAAKRTGADVVYPGCDVERDGALIPVAEEWGRFGREFDADLLLEQSYIPVTSLARMSLVDQTAGFQRARSTVYDDWGFYLNLLDVGANFHHEPVITWKWHHGNHNTSGMGDRW